MKMIILNFTEIVVVVTFIKKGH